MVVILAVMSLVILSVILLTPGKDDQEGKQGRGGGAGKINTTRVTVGHLQPAAAEISLVQRLENG